MRKELKLVLLIVWFILCGAVYYTAVHFEFEAIVIIYGIMSIVFGIAFFLVNGGVRPTVKIQSDAQDDTATKKQIKRDRYKKRDTALSVDTDRMRINIFGLSPEKQKFYAELFLILFLPPVCVLAADYLLISFLPDYN